MKGRSKNKLAAVGLVLCIVTISIFSELTIGTKVQSKKSLLNPLLTPPIPEEDQRISESIETTGITPAAIPGTLLIKIKSGIDVSSPTKAFSEIQKITDTNPSFAQVTTATPLLSEHVLKYKSEEKSHYGLDRWIEVRVDTDIDLSSEIAKYQHHPSIEYAEPSYVTQLCTIPNDPEFPLQYGLHNTGQTGGTPGVDIDAPEAWNITTGDEQIIIAVVGTGVDYDHPDLAENIWINEAELTGISELDDDGNGYIDDIYGYDFCTVDQERDSDPMDEYGHGTHCAGIAAAVTNNSDGIAGVCWNATIMTVKFVDYRGYGDDIDAAVALIYAADNGADIISCSWGFPWDVQHLRDATTYAAQSSIVVAASGNHDSYWKKLYPAAYEEALSVTATDHLDEKAYYSSYSDYGDRWVDIAAPGHHVYSTYLDDTYEYISGTSMATPLVSGVAGLIKTENASWSNQEIIGQILSTTDNIDVKNPGFENLLGTGRLNAYKALTMDPGTSVVFLRYTVDDTSGNNNGFLDPGESVMLNITLRNNWFDASNVQATLSTEHTDITISSSQMAYDDMTAFERVTRSFPLSFNPAASVNQLIDFTIDVTADGGYVQGHSFKVEVPYPVQDGWPAFSEVYGLFGAPTLGDIDGDGDSEIVICNLDGHVYAYNSDGSQFDGWPAVAEGYYAVRPRPPALADIDNDGKLEVFSVSDYPHGNIFGFDDNGSLLDGWPQQVTFYFGESSPALGDLDNDGDYEVVFINDKYLHAWHHNGTAVAGIGTKEVPEESFHGSPALADIDHDGDLEIFAIGKKVNCWHHNGSSATGFPADYCGAGSSPTASPVIVDLDNNGELEIIAPVGHLSVLDRFGTILWSKDSDTTNYYTPAIGDIDTDGDLEIIISTYNSSSSVDYLYAYHHNGSEVAGWPVAKEKQGSQRVWGLPVIGDIDSDRVPEIVISTDDNIDAYHSDGTWVDDFPIVRYGVHSNDLEICTLGDIDGDGDVEILVGSDKAYVFDCPGIYHSLTMHWPSYQCDQQHTGFYQYQSIDPNQSDLILLSDGLTTCPSGHTTGLGIAYNQPLVMVSIVNPRGEPISGIPASSFSFSVAPTEGTQYHETLSCTFESLAVRTNESGEIQFEIIGDTSINGTITITVIVDDEVLSSSVDLHCNSFDIHLDGIISIIDFALFAQDYGNSTFRSDFNWDGIINLPDFAMFASHYGHIS